MDKSSNILVGDYARLSESDWCTGQSDGLTNKPDGSTIIEEFFGSTV